MHCGQLPDKSVSRRKDGICHHKRHHHLFGHTPDPDLDIAEKACAALNDKEIMGRKMKCNEAKNLI
jgi:hypothetical protein